MTAFPRRPVHLPGWVALAVALVALLLKMPDVLLHGRFWAEEGTTFGGDLIDASARGALAYVYKGTHVILTSLIVWVSLQGPLALAPLVTTWLSTLVLLLVVVQYAGWTRANRVPVVAALAGLVALLFLSSLPEVIATATNLQWVCSVSCLFLFLADRDELDRWIVPAAIWAVLCGLTGAPPSMLAPFLLLRGVLDRSRAHLVLGVLLAGCALLQIRTLHGSDLGPRHYHLDALWAAASVVQQTVMIHILPLDLVGAIGWRIAAGARTMPVVLAFILLVAGGVVAIAWIAGRRSDPRARAWLLAGPWLFVTTVNMVGALEGTFPSAITPPVSARYYLVGSVCFLLLLLWGTRSDRPVLRGAMLAIVGWIAVLGLVRSATGWPGFYLHGPSWQEQLPRCRLSGRPTCRVAIWPRQEPQIWVFPLARSRVLSGSGGAGTRASMSAGHRSDVDRPGS